MEGTTKIGVIIVLLVCLVRLGEGGECCRAHYNIIGNEVSNDQKWCDNYCCFNLIKYDCCNNIIMRAPADMRMDFCAAWFADHWYVPLLVVLGIVASLITCCVCCCCACCACRNRSSGTVVAPPQGLLVVTQQQQPVPLPNDQSSSHANPFNSGYDQ
ncbi:uncharacterized protein [Argopecten irradians]|uniref:uncharacterized protein n=1 Tax=Argopecten irradians TaxID=31199 RepID=UPI00371F7807